MSDALAVSLDTALRKGSGSYSEAPRRVFLGAKPGRDPLKRGGLWSERLLEARSKISEREYLDKQILALSSGDANLVDFLALSQDLPVEFPMAGELPGEVSFPISTTQAVANEGGLIGGQGGVQQLNTNTGNLQREHVLSAWGLNGDQRVVFALTHNSKSNLDTEVGKGWLHSYSGRISFDAAIPGVFQQGDIAIVRMGDGLEIPFTYATGVHTHPTHQNGAWSFGSATGGHWQAAGIFKGMHLVPSTVTPGTFVLIDARIRESLRVYRYNLDHYLVADEDERGNRVTVTRNAQNIPTQVSDGLGRSLTFTLSNGRITQVTDPTGKIHKFTYDGAGNLVSIEYPSLGGTVHTRTFTYNANSDILSETDRRGKVWSWTYDHTGSVTSSRNPLNATTSIQYTNSSVVSTSPMGRAVTHNYSVGRIASIVDQAGFSEAFAYNASGLLTTYTDKRGGVWTRTYDANLNRVASATDPLGRTTSFQYGSSTGFPVSVTGPNGDVASATTNQFGDYLTLTGPGNRLLSTMTYDVKGNMTSETDALGRTTSLQYDAYGNLTRVTRPDQTFVQAQFDLMGHPTQAVDAAGGITTLSLDAWYRPWKATFADGTSSQIQHNAEGNVVSAVDELGRSGSIQYDDAGRLISITNALGQVHSYFYDGDGHLIRVRNARGKERLMEVSPRGETTKITLPDGSQETWTYNANGEEASYTNALGQTVINQIDAVGRLIKRDLPTGVDPAFTYDSADRIVSMQDATGTSTWVYNAQGDVQRLSTPQGILDYAYNTVGQKTLMTEVSIGSTSYGYDAFGRPSTEIGPFGDSQSYVYDSAGRISRKNLSNGTYETYSYDQRGRPVGQSLKNSSGQTLVDHLYTLDSAGQVISEVRNGVTTSYSYDLAGQLLSESKSTGYSALYTYDPVGNRLTRSVNGTVETYAYDDGDKLLSVAGGADPRTFTYDAAGRTTSVVRASGTTSYNSMSRDN